MNISKVGPELIWTGEPTLLLVNFSDDKKFLLPNNSVPNILVPISGAQNMGDIMKKVNMVSQVQQPNNVHAQKLPAINNQFNAAHQINQYNPRKDASKEIHSINGISNPVLVNCNAVNNAKGPGDHKPDVNMFGGNGIKREPNHFNGMSPSLVPSTDITNAISPMQQSNCDSNSYDMLLNNAVNNMPKSGNVSKMDKLLSDKNAYNNYSMGKKDEVMPSTSQLPPASHFNDNLDVDLMELIGQQLDMDISEDTCQQMNDDKMFNMPGSNCSDSMSSFSSPMSMSYRRDMNPSLQPSLSELIQIQQQQVPNSSSSGRNSMNMNDAGDSNLNMNNNNLHVNDYSNSFYMDNNIGSCNNNSLTLGSMDIEYFDNSLANFDFAVPCTSQSNSLIADNPSNQAHPYSDNHMIMASAAPSASASMSDVDRMNCFSNTNGTGSSVDASNQGNMLDLLNDFKMANDPISWGEVDYAV